MGSIEHIRQDTISHHKAKNRDQVKPEYAFNDTMHEIIKKSSKKPKVEKPSGGEVHLHTRRESPLSFIHLDPEAELEELIEDRLKKIQKFLRG